MSNIVRIKRRAAGGAAGAPSSLQNAELAFNEQDLTLYYGLGTGGAGGSATSVIPIAGAGAFVALTGNQSIGGIKTFLQTIQGDISGNAGTATKLATARSISIIGDATWTVSFDGSNNASGTLTLKDTGVTAGTYGSTTSVPVITLDSKGRVVDASTATISSALNFTGDVTGSGTTGTPVTLTLSDSGVSSGTYTKVSVDSKGRVTGGTQASLSDLAVPTGDINVGGFKFTNVADPVAGTDAANKQYVDSVAQGLDVKASVKVATTENITLSGLQNVDGITLAEGDRVLVKNQTDSLQNGIYVASASAWTRASDAASWDQMSSGFTFVEKGMTQADTGWVCTIDAGEGTLGSSGGSSATPQRFTAGAGDFMFANWRNTDGGSGPPDQLKIHFPTGTLEAALNAGVPAGTQFSIESMGGEGVVEATQAAYYSQGEEAWIIPITIVSGTPNYSISAITFTVSASSGGTTWQDFTSANFAFANWRNADGGSGPPEMIRISGPDATLLAKLNAATIGSQIKIESMGGNGTIELVSGFYYDTGLELWTAAITIVSGTPNFSISKISFAGAPAPAPSITWAQFSGAGTYLSGNGLSLNGNTFSVLANGSSIDVSGSGIKIADTYAGQTSITTLGTVTSGTWLADTIAVSKGGTGATSLTGYVKGNGTGAMTASTTIPSTDISGLGTMSVQSASAVAITGGSITNLSTFDGVTVDGGAF